ncbi:hypothetical protein RIF29_04202 [Crotalaria pallida]|uniref:Uncharacterized protein n=1 Tax=Crotalaria pallida TaxID=3830 RepID=A0AAN9J0R6_CROPI
MERENQNASLKSSLIKNSVQDGFIVDEEQNKSSAIERTDILEEVKKQLWLAGPLITVNLLNYCLQVISVMFVGHLGELALSSASMATSFASVTASNFVDGLQCVLSGTARGCGWQKIGACVNLGSYYIVGLPSAIVLAFVLHIGGKGLWLGIICALIVQAVSLLIITIRTDWEQEVKFCISAKKATETVYDSITPDSIVS